jgi:hypothetical protein
MIAGFISVQLIPQISTVQFSVIITDFEPIKLELKLRISSKQNKHGGRAKQSKNCLPVENDSFYLFLMTEKKLSQTRLIKVTCLGDFLRPLSL